MNEKAPWFWIGPIAIFPHSRGLIILNERRVIIKEWRFRFPRPVLNLVDNLRQTNDR